jgi:hypothetical protein
MSIIHRIEQKGVFYFGGQDADSIKIEGEYIVLKWNVTNAHSVIFGRNTRICIEQLKSNFENDTITGGVFELYSSTIKFDDIVFSSSNDDSIALLGIYDVKTTDNIHQMNSSYPAHNLFNNGTFILKIRCMTANYQSFEYTGMNEVPYENGTAWRHIFKRFGVKFQVYDEILSTREDMAKTTPNDLIIGKMQDNLHFK